MIIPEGGRRLAEAMLRLPRKAKGRVQAVTDVVCVFLAIAGVGWLSTALSPAHLLPVATSVAMLTVAMLAHLSAYRAWVRYFGVETLVTLVGLAGMASMSLAVIHRVSLGAWLPVSAVVDGWLITTAALSAPRLIARLLFLQVQKQGREPVVIYGAGAAGRELASALRSGGRYRVAGFVDDEMRVQGSTVMDIPVRAPEALVACFAEHGVKRVLLAMPRLSRDRRREIVSWLVDLGVTVQSVPGVHDLVAGEARIDELQNLDVQDLLGRDAIPPVAELIEHDIRSRVVMITGGGGSIGSELARQAVQRRARKVVVYDHSELALYTIEQELQESCHRQEGSTEVVCVLGDVLCVHDLQRVMEQQQVETVYHAAAYKHVPLVEANPCRGVENNVLGTLAVAQAAAATEVESFVLVSTDKAVRPTNIMGASKRFAELVIQALAKVHARTRFSIVRFGNVLNSSGSVVPLFRSQIAQGGPVTVTHPDVIRYFMTIPEAAQLVIQAGAQGKHAEVFLLDMGSPIRIMDLADKMVRLAGLQPYVSVDQSWASAPVACPQGSVAIMVSGLRPGEKLYEELLVTGNEAATRHPRIVMAEEPSLNWAKVQVHLADLRDSLRRRDVEALQSLLLSLPLQYRPDRAGKWRPADGAAPSLPSYFTPTSPAKGIAREEGVVTSI